LLLNQIQERNKEKINERTTNFMSEKKRKKKGHHRVWDMWEENERKKWKKCADHMRDKKEAKLVRELVNEYYSSKLVSIFTYQNFFVELVRLLGVGF
jgi:hypothetical protein